MSSPRLRELILTRAFSFGSFTLASGKTSSFYINSKKILFHSEAIALLADAFWEKMHDLDIQAVGGLEVGAIPLTSAIVYRYHQAGRNLEGFFVRKQAKDHGSKERIEGVELKPGMRVAIVDDVLTTGGSALQAVQEVERAGATVVAVLCIVDREQGAREAFAKYTYRPLFTLTDLGIKPGV
jgi:orotate phosphoribosyltransferase